MYLRFTCRYMRRCKNINISSVFSSQKTSIALIHLETVPGRERLGPMCPRCWFPGPKCMRYLRNRWMKVMRFAHAASRREISGMELVEREGRYAKNRNAHHPARNIGWRATHSSAAIEAAFVSPLLPLIPFAPFRCILRTPGFQPTFCFALDAERRDAKEIVSRPRDLSPNFAECHEETGEKLCCLWRIDKCADEKMLFAKFTRTSRLD